MNQTLIESPADTGWQAQLELNYRRHGNRTLLEHRHRGPLRVQRPFFPEGGVNHTYLLHPPGGLVGNDRLTIALRSAADAHALVTTPGATKAYRNVCGGARVEQTFDVDGTVEWLPQETILFNGSRLTSDTTFNLGTGGRLIAWEVQCLGRPHGDQPYLSGQARFRLCVGTPAGWLLHDHLVFAGDAPLLSTPWGLNGHTALGVMLAYPADQALLDGARRMLERAQLPVAATLVDNLLIVRVMAAQAQTIRQAFIGVWREIRPQLLGLPACEPRIWAT